MSTAVTKVNGKSEPGAMLPLIDGELRELVLDDLHESPWNPRQYYPDKEMAELTESMRQSGFRSWLPIVVRPLPDAGGYEIGAGHRRSRAAREAGLSVVPCIVRHMTDVEFLDVLNFDNCGREDVHPLHEAAGWTAWMEKTGKGVVDIAARIGQSKEYVYQRLKYSALSEDGKKAFLDEKITAGHAILIARLQPNEQKKALKFCEPPDWDPRRIPGVRELMSFIQRDVHLDLSTAAFDLGDETLVPAAGTCAACPKRTKNSPELILAEADPDSDDECTDPGCFNAKLGAHLVRIKNQLTAKGTELIEVSSSYAKPKKGVLGPNEYRIASKGEKGTKTALVTAGEDAGTVIQIKLQPKRDESSANEAREREHRRRKALVARERAVRVEILKIIRTKVAGLTRADLECLLGCLLSSGNFSGAAVLCEVRGIDLPKEHCKVTSKLREALAKMSEVEIFRLIVEVPVASECGDEWQLGRNEAPSSLLALAKRYKVDAAKIRSEVEEELKEAEGGTRREVEKQAAKKPAPATKKTKKKTPAKKPAKPPVRKKAGKR